MLAIAGIVVGMLLFGLIVGGGVVVVILFLKRKRRKRQQLQEDLNRIQSNQNAVDNQQNTLLTPSISTDHYNYNFCFIS